MKMYEKKKKAVVPSLRFPEFRDAGEWEVKRLGGVAEFLDNMRRPISRSKRKQGTYPYYGASGAIDHIDEYIFDERLLLIGEDGAKWGPFEKTAFIVEGKYWVNNHAHVLRPVASNDVLLENYLNATDVSVYVTGFAPPKLTLDNLKSIRIPISPVQEEQQKIADCLASLDDLIRAGEAQLVALKDHKKGLMQQLFPREGETSPRLRFPEFRDAGEWEVKRLGEVCDFLKGKGLPKKEITPAGSVPCVHYGELFTDYGEIIRRVKSFTNGDNNYVLSEVDDVLMPTSDVTPNGLAKASCIKQSSVVLGGDILVIRLNKELVFGEYLSRLIRFREQEVFRYVSGTTVFHLYPDSISKLRVLLPRLPEQQKIADCLASLDDLIRAGEAQLVALKDHKKGLMQQLFPQEVG